MFFTSIDIVGELIHILHKARHGSGHKFWEVVRLEVRRLVRNIRIGRTMGFIKAIACEVHEQVKYFVCNGLFDAIIDGTLYKGFPLRLEDGFLFLTHRTTHQIRLTKRESTHGRCNLHNLFLVENNAERIFQDRFQDGMQIGHLFFTMATVDKIRHHARAQRTWAIKCNERD